MDNVGANAFFKPDGFLQSKKCFSEKNVCQITTMQGNNEFIVEFHNSIKGTMHFLRFWPNLQFNLDCKHNNIYLRFGLIIWIICVTKRFPIQTIIILVVSNPSLAVVIDFIESQMVFIAIAIAIQVINSIVFPIRSFRRWSLTNLDTRKMSSVDFPNVDNWYTNLGLSEKKPMYSSSNEITTTWIQISRLFWFWLFLKY